MDLKQKLIDLSREATGDQEITVAGDFQPKGMTWKIAASAGAGSLIGGTVDASGVGAVIGGAAGRMAASSGDLPAVVVLAASPKTLYVMTSNNGKGIILAKHLLLLGSIDREHVSVEMQQKATVRTAIITDTSNGSEYKLEGKRILFHHMNDMLDALAADEDADDHQTAVVAE